MATAAATAEAEPEPELEALAEADACRPQQGSGHHMQTCMDPQLWQKHRCPERGQALEETPAGS